MKMEECRTYQELDDIIKTTQKNPDLLKKLEKCKTYQELEESIAKERVPYYYRVS